MLSFLKKNYKFFALGILIFLLLYTVVFFCTIKTDINEKMGFLLISWFIFFFSFGAFFIGLKIQSRLVIISQKVWNFLLIFLLVLCTALTTRFIIGFLITPATNHYMIPFPLNGVLMSLLQFNKRN